MKKYVSREMKYGKTYVRISGDVQAIQFPDDGPSQHEVGQWVKDKGGDMNLYDGNAENNVETSTKANWRWRSASIENSSINIGDWIVLDIDGQFRVFNNETFKALFHEN